MRPDDRSDDKPDVAEPEDWPIIGCTSPVTSLKPQYFDCP